MEPSIVAFEVKRMIETGLTREGGVTFMRHPGGNILLGHKQAPGVGAVETQLAFA